jgi:hypothetical protein
MGRDLTAVLKDDALYTVSTQQFAEKLGVSTQTIRARYRQEGRLIGRQILYSWLFVETEYAASWDGDPKEYTVPRTEAAVRTGFHRDVVSRKLKGVRKGRETFFRDHDVRRLEQKARDLEWVNEDAITEMLGAEHPVQTFYLRWRLQRGGSYEYFAWYRRGVRGFPYRDRRTRAGQHLWRRKKVERFALKFRADPATILTDDGLREYNAAPHAAASTDSRMRTLWRFFRTYNGDIAMKAMEDREDEDLNASDEMDHADETWD